MASRRAQALLLGVVVLIVLLAMFTAPAPDRDAFDPRASSFRPASAGTLALYLTLQELRIDVDRRLGSWVDGPPLQRPLVLLAPQQALTPLEIDALVGWVERGGVLFYAARRGDPLLERLGLALTAARGQGGSGARAELRARRHSWTAGVEEVTGFAWLFADTSAALTGAVPLLADGAGRVGAAELRLGEGRLIAWSDVYPLTNEALRESGAALIFARAAADLLGAEHSGLDFDEYHHGYREESGIGGALLAFLGGTGAGRMTLQLTAVCLALLFLYGRRFGLPHPPPPLRRRSPLEHVEALAGAYRQGGARLTARRLLVAGLARRLGRTVPAAGVEADWLDELAARVPAARGPARAMLAEWRRGAGLDLVALAHRSDELASTARSR